MDLIKELDLRKNIVNNAIYENLRFSNNNFELYNAMRYLIVAGGKRLRPIITMLFYEIFGKDSKDVLSAGIALELIHNFTLIHDDIMDKDEYRRNIKTTHIVYGEPLAILAGDTLLARSFEILASCNLGTNIISEVAKTVQDIAVGQALDMQYEKRNNVSDADYLNMINLKTAVLFAYAAKLGAIIANCNALESESAYQYGKNLGLAFQMRDDILGIVGDTKTTGKPVGSDIIRGKKTLLVVYALQKSSEKDYLLENLPCKNIENLSKCIEIINSVNAVQYVENKALEYSKIAKTNLKVFPKTNATKILDELANYTVIRNM